MTDKSFVRRLTAAVNLAICGFPFTMALAQVQVSQGYERIHVEIDGQPYGDFVFDPATLKPYFYPLRTAKGTIVTRGYPMEQVAGETRDHPHHRGLWIGHISVNGVDFWSNEASYHQPNSQ